MAEPIGKRQCFTCSESVFVGVQKNGYAWFQCAGCRTRVFAGSPQADRSLRKDMTPLANESGTRPAPEVESPAPVKAEESAPVAPKKKSSPFASVLG